MDLSRVKFNGAGKAYVEYLRKSGRKKGYIRAYGQILVCSNCGEKCFLTDSNIKESGGKYCSQKCEPRGAKNPNWKGGKIKTAEGYILYWIFNHPYVDKKGYVLEHRFVVEEQIGRYLYPGEEVHHINGIKSDNRPENLMAFKNKREHLRFERDCPVDPEDIVFDGRGIKD